MDEIDLSQGSTIPLEYLTNAFTDVAKQVVEKGISCEITRDNVVIAQVSPFIEEQDNGLTKFSYMGIIGVNGLLSRKIDQGKPFLMKAFDLVVKISPASGESVLPANNPVPQTLKAEVA